ncbi:toll/interleukin-1 receptor domain-containing protein [Curtobacterium sp. MCBA15_013]|uniref:toll/interleukin-1 receptor domain-containing protein n=1 Tax=Curtobacterium sp. MCBA15_013 TaxID=1898739 RepID=UPI0008DC600A|nr:toll/interleukin-1 receptor domain-containing protein [Curtobacterium sp. MCBA15_013]OII24131.1 hypothetical protein BIV01_15155 [Curtobacterium sp. MCBA15_013]
MTSGSASGFWSYVHADDEASHGRIAQLARDIKAEYEMQTAESVELFLDRDDLDWGDSWRSRIDTAITSAAFFVPVITPRFFKSVECRRELTRFAERATALGVKELIMPILWVDVPALADASKRDDVMDMIVDFQWVPWTILRHAPRESAEYTTAVAQLAARIVAVNAAVDELDLADAAISAEDEDEDEDDGLGLIEQLADMELSMPEWVASVEAMSADIAALGQVAEEGSAELTEGGPHTKTFAGRLTLLRGIATRLQEPADALQAHGEEFTSKLASVDRGVHLIIERANQEVEGEPESRAAFETYFESLRALDAESQSTATMTEGFLESVLPLRKLSRDMKRPVQAIQNGLILMREGVDVIHGWVGEIDSLGWDTQESD